MTKFFKKCKKQFLAHFWATQNFTQNSVLNSIFNSGYVSLCQIKKTNERILSNTGFRWTGKHEFIGPFRLKLGVQKITPDYVLPWVFEFTQDFREFVALNITFEVYLKPCQTCQTSL